MYSTEQIEKVRQEIMRFHELLGIMREKLEDGERAYAKLFASVPASELEGLREKDQQGRLAQTLIDDLTPLSNAVIRARFDAHELERAFEELYDIIVTIPESDAD
jgi:hypothetical protein